MAKKEMRMLVAAADMAGVIDHGAEIDTQLKNLTFEDKGIKTKLTDTLSPEIQKGESSVRFCGKVAAAVITAVEKIDIDCSSEAFPKVREAIDNGILEGVVDRKLSLVVPPLELNKAAEVLKQAGLHATLAETLSVTAEALRQKALTEDLVMAIGQLEKCVKRETTYRVKYEKVQA
jgi:hypothetical protein